MKETRPAEFFPSSTVGEHNAEQNQCDPWSGATNLLGLDGGLTAVSSVVVAEGSVVDRVTVVVPHERLHRRHNQFSRTFHQLGNG